ncbi:TPA: acyl carrier protein [Klebsiella oxytoca]|nr:acyl carrier protein [Klebsiella oxytoca]
MTDINEKIDQRKSILVTIKAELIHRLNIQREEHQIDDDTPLFGNGLKLDSVDATEIIVMLDKSFNIQVQEGDDPSYMRSINSLASFIIQKKHS